MRVPALLAGISLASLLAGGCATYREYDHRDEMYRADRAYDYERPKRHTSRKVSGKRATSVAKARKPAYQADKTPPQTSLTALAPSPAKPTEAAPAAPPRETVAKPASTAKPAPPAAAPTPSDPAVATARKEIANGYRLLRAGFVSKARQRFETAVPAAGGEATLALARSHDPTYLSGVAFPDVAPDADQARTLYQRAIGLGSDVANEDLKRLDSTPTASKTAAPAATSPAQ